MADQIAQMRGLVMRLRCSYLRYLPGHAKRVLIQSADNESPDQPVHV